jgi:N-formylglutamate amidohydrolase
LKLPASYGDRSTVSDLDGESWQSKTARKADALRWNRNWIAIGILLISCHGLCPAQDTLATPLTDQEMAGMLRLSEGDLPCMISAPHGGRQVVPGVAPRTGDGMAKGASGFFAGRDSFTEELALQVIDCLEERLQAKPFQVISSVHRKYVDFNRPVDIAIESSRIEPLYQRYHDALASYANQIKQRFPGGLLLDIHGQGTRRDLVYRGTQNGRTVQRLIDAFGIDAHSGSQSLFGMLQQRGWGIYPIPLDGKEQAGFTGGHIVRTYGSHTPFGLEAIQLEFGADYRSNQEARSKTAEDLADVIIAFLDRYHLWHRVAAPVDLGPPRPDRTQLQGSGR